MKFKKIYSYVSFILFILFSQNIMSGSAYVQQKSFRETFIIDRRFEKSFDFVNNGLIEAINNNGDIQIKTWNKQEVFISASYRRMRNIDVELDVFKRGDVLTFEVIYPENRWYRRSYSSTVDLSITIPKLSNLEVESMNGSVEIRGVSGEIHAESLNDEVILENVKGTIKAESMNNMVSINGVSGKVECESMNAGIKIENSTCSRINAGSVNGKVNVTTTIDPEGYYDFDSTNGDIILTIPENSRATIRAEAPRNRFYSDFDIDIIDRERRRDRDWDWGPRKFTLKINGGGARITLSTTNGEIEIRKR